jgi:hypothetical protein
MGDVVHPSGAGLAGEERGGVRGEKEGDKVGWRERREVGVEAAGQYEALVAREVGTEGRWSRGQDKKVRRRRERVKGRVGCVVSQWAGEPEHVGLGEIGGDEGGVCVLTAGAGGLVGRDGEAPGKGEGGRGDSERSASQSLEAAGRRRRVYVRSGRREIATECGGLKA